MPDDVCFLPALQLAARLHAGELSPVEVVEAFLARIEARDPSLGAYVHVLADRAREQARRAEQALVSGAPVGPLHGVPVAVKDLFDPLAGVPNSFGCAALADYVPDATVTYIERLEQAGAIILGKTNTSEFGHKGVTDNALFGPTSTPFSLGHNAGGSSGGSAAAVADGLCAVAQGSDAGGSIRIPASCCGVFGLKPSAGRVAAASRPDGFVSSPFVDAGPLARTVGDAALMLGVMAGSHPRDPRSLPDQGCDYVAATRRSIEGLRIAYSPDLDVFPVERSVLDVVEQALPAFLEAGAVLQPVSLGLRASQSELCDLWLRQMSVVYATMVSTLKSQGLDLLGRHRDELSPHFVALVERGNSMRAVDFKLDDNRRSEFFDTIQGLFTSYDVLITPTLCTPPFLNDPQGDTLGPAEVAGIKVDPRLGWSMAYPFNFTGHPAASVPAGLTDDGLPVGMQIIGRRFADDVVLAASAALERARPWAGLYPGLASAARDDRGELSADKEPADRDLAGAS